MNKTDNARARALLILEEWQGQATSLDLLVEKALRRPFTDHRDNQLCRALAYGVVRRLGYLDALLARYSNHPLRKMKPLTRQALRIGLYQLLFMDRVPASAAINETVKLLKERGQPRWLTGFVNGLLRRLDRERAALPRQDQTGGRDFAPYELLSHPRWLYDRWLGRYGADRTASLCQANNREAGLCLRTAGISRDEFIDRLAAAGIRGEKGVFSPQAVLLPDFRSAVPDLPGYGEGFFQVQDEAAQLAAGILGPSLAGGRYLDGCAGLGGKTCLLAERLAKDASLLAVEPDRRRYELLGANLARMDLAGKVATLRGALEDLGPENDQGFRGILVDAPCSGLGVIRRHPDIRWNRQPADLARYRSQQLALLNQAARLLAPAGIVVYLTCSTEPEENEQVVEEFLAGRPDFRVEDCRAYLPEPAAELVDGQGFFHTLPDQGLDGFFGARLVKGR
ncbi:MAG: 16S rRNA (cytosine(967)-C(5))-methyltransferase RsmB [Desulfurivibrionaceae bacterium]|nr:16S rRNA (cytosine(967)-C(5))-methyltransferase RsmB [Desulfobulbales bacterium]MDT8335001.1 16S rRNA (cytosine(967)-C(5))-methyltransferase RsmB [Desulfurivibrionaceae bacterium]